MKLAVCFVSLGLVFADAAFEKRFLDSMARHHEGGIEMAQACQEKASGAELRQLCTTMAVNQGLERQQLQDWRKQWHQDQGGMAQAEVDKLTADHKQRMAKLNTLVGEAFDTTFIQMMTEHYRQGVTDAGACSTNAEHAELKQLCGKMAADQQKEIGQMQEWLK